MDPAQPSPGYEGHFVPDIARDLLSAEAEVERLRRALRNIHRVNHLFVGHDDNPILKAFDAVRDQAQAILAGGELPEGWE